VEEVQEAASREEEEVQEVAAEGKGRNSVSVQVALEIL